jgi:hypothetical protein
MNKFEALKQFQAWPPEWQRLCAECWIETGEVDPTQVATFGERLAVSPIQFDQPETVPTYPREIRRAGRAKNMNPLKPWSIADDETLVKLHDTGIRRSEIIMRFMADHPYRTFNAVASRHDHLRRLDWKVQ